MKTNSVRAKANFSVSCGRIKRKLDLSKDKRRKTNPTVKQPCGKKQQGTISSGDQMSLKDRRKLKEKLMVTLNRKTSENLQSRLRKSGIQCFGKERIVLDIDGLDDDSIWKLKNVLNGSLDACSAIEDRILSTNARKLDMRLPGLQEENTCRRPGTPVTKTISGTSLMVDDQCVKRALQLAKSTKRYGEIMSKSMTMSNKADPRQMQQETEIWEQFNKKDELDRNHQKEREAFRTALEKVERNVEFEDNLLILKELETLSQCSLSDYLYGSGSWMSLRDLRSGKVLNPLEQLGLRIKKEFTADDDDDDDTFLCSEAEEGEILE